MIYERAIPLGESGDHKTTDRATAQGWKAAGHAVTPDPGSPAADDGDLWRALLADTNAQPCAYPCLRDCLADWLVGRK